MKISLIVAKDDHNGIGKDNDLLWHLPADMRFFRETTIGHIVLMGRKNYESIPEKFRPLPGRLNMILTHNKSFQASDCLILHSVEEVLGWKEANKEDERTLFIIGGGEIYRQFLKTDQVEEMFVTQVDAVLDADTFFPEIDEAVWQKELVLEHSADEKNKFGFRVWKYYR